MRSPSVQGPPYISDISMESPQWPQYGPSCFSRRCLAAWWRLASCGLLVLKWRFLVSVETRANLVQLDRLILVCQNSFGYFYFLQISKPYKIPSTAGIQASLYENEWSHNPQSKLLLYSNYECNAKLWILDKREREDEFKRCIQRIIKQPKKNPTNKQKTTNNII